MSVVDELPECIYEENLDPNSIFMLIGGQT